MRFSKIGRTFITSQKSAEKLSGRQKSKPGFKGYLEIAESYRVSDHIFGICEQRYVYREVLGVNVDFYKDLGIKS